MAEVSGRPFVTAYTPLSGEAKGTLNLHVNTIKIHNFAKKEETKQRNTAVVGDLLEPLDDLPF